LRCRFSFSFEKQDFFAKTGSGHTE
jgi:hypothetical protein